VVLASAVQLIMGVVSFIELLSKGKVMLTIGTVLSIVYTSFGLGVELQSVFHTPSVISLFDEVLS
jgi:hypothetical protein